LPHRHLGDRRFRADERRVRQILFNLLSNAIRFSPAGGEIRVGAERNGETITFTVADNGSGIPQEYLDTVFDRFESHAGGAGRGGAGRGLSIVKSCAELRGGRVEIASGAESGTTVTVRLPVDPEAVAEAAE
jgi:signal transduction histidine kinase